MLPRPLDLSRRLRPHPRSFDWIYVVNVGLIAGFFAFFGSRFVVSPGLGIDFQLPEVPGATADARVTTHVITIVNAGQIVVDDGLRNLDQLALWLAEQSKRAPRPSLLVRASAEVPAATLARILGLAHSAGFQVTVAAEDHPRRGAAAAPAR